MITHMLPWGLKGLVTAAMLAAAMQTCSAALNSTATLFAYDIFQRWRPQTTDHQLVVIGKITTVVATVLAIACSPLFGHYDTIYEGLTDLICYIAPPITAVFLLGVFWKRASGRAAFSRWCRAEPWARIVFVARMVQSLYPLEPQLHDGLVLAVRALQRADDRRIACVPGTAQGRSPLLVWEEPGGRCGARPAAAAWAIIGCWQAWWS